MAQPPTIDPAKVKASHQAGACQWRCNQETNMVDARLGILPTRTPRKRTGLADGADNAPTQQRTSEAEATSGNKPIGIGGVYLGG